MSDKPFERVLARCKKIDVEFEDHGILVVRGGFDLDKGGYYGMPDYCINAAFLYRLLAVFGNPVRLRELEGKPCWITAKFQIGTFYEISKIEPLFETEGRVFDVNAWREWSEKYERYTPRELLEGVMK